MRSPNVLLVEDDPVVQGALAHALTDQGFTVRVAGTAMDALRSVTEQETNVIVLDLGLPDLDGTSVLPMLRGITDIPVIAATARADERSMVALLNAGADDYVVKPFATEQLVARIRAVLRRVNGTPEDSEVLTVGELSIDLPARTATLDGQRLELNRREFDLLAHLAAHAGRVVTRRQLIRAVWHQPDMADDQTIDVHISWLRRKLGETAARPRYLHTVRGVGLKLTAPG
jgi:DNA-binding response OmpR family regulator